MISTMNKAGSIDREIVFSTRMLTDESREYLSKVYVLLSFGCLLASAGTQLWTKIPGYHTASVIISFASLFGVLMIQKAKYLERLGCFSLFAFSNGYSIGALVEIARILDSDILTSAVVTTFAVFASFSCVALTAKRRSFLYLGSILGSMLNLLILGSLMRFFFDSSMLFDLRLYLGLVTFCGYIIYDTQLIIERFFLGEIDEIRSALTLFLDAFAIFVRILIILIKLKSKGKKSSKGKK